MLRPSGNLHAPLITAPVLKKQVQGEARCYISAGLPEGREYPVRFLSGKGASNLRRLLPQEGGVGAEPSFPLQGERALVEGPRKYEKLVHPFYFIIGQRRREAAVDVSLFIKHLESFYCEGFHDTFRHPFPSFLPVSIPSSFTEFPRGEKQHAADGKCAIVTDIWA